VNACYPFLPDDLDALWELYNMSADVVAMSDVFDGATDPNVLAVRHDCDNVIHPAVEFAGHEGVDGVRSTYYILHTSPYWQDKTLLRESLERIAGYGHEIGIHNDALTVALETGRDPADILHEAIEDLRGYGHTIRSTVAHGNGLCRIANYVNDEMFVGCARPDKGAANRTLEHGGRTVTLSPRPLAEFGLDFDSSWLPRGDYLSDSGGRWSQPFEEVAAAWPSRGQLHMLVHPDWWSEAFERAEAAA
jgi:hypothetical protein